MASRITGGAVFRRTLKRLPATSRQEVAKALDQAIRMVQATAVTLVPVMTGRLRGSMLKPSAIGKREHGMRVEFGFRTKALQRMAFYAPFVEYGTKAYRPGQYRLSGRNKAGTRANFKKIKRVVPARPARPFIRPALDINMPAIRRLTNAAVRRAIRSAVRG